MSSVSASTNSCAKIPIDLMSKMPKTEYERTTTTLTEQNSTDSYTNCSMSTVNLDTEKVKDFYRSIPDYNEINHLSPTEFYSTLKSLREKKKFVLGLTKYNMNHCKSLDYEKYFDDVEDTIIKKRDNEKSNTILNIKSEKVIKEETLPNQKILKDIHFQIKQKKGKLFNDDKIPGGCLKLSQTKNTETSCKLLNKGRSQRNHSACSISWHDDKLKRDKNEIDKKFDKFFEINKVDLLNSREFKTQSMPSSPLRNEGFGGIKRKSKNFTVPKPFRMTKRDDEERIVNELRTLRRSFSEDMLTQKHERKQFRARPVPIESRIPLYAKILEDQAMRRALTKINSEAELRAQMKPFSFTKREEKGIPGLCEKAIRVLPKTIKRKHFRARPVPKNLFSNYFYDRNKEDEFFRSIKHRIRAEEMLCNANYPRNMASRDRSRLSTPAAHSDLPTDPSPVVPSTSPSDRFKCSIPTKTCKTFKDDFITTSPQPFRFKTVTRAKKKMLDIAQKVYQSSKNTDSLSDFIAKPQTYSALELKGSATGRSNLAAVLRAESVRKKFEMEAANLQVEQSRRQELRQRSRQLRSKPAWHLVKNNHEEDIAMRLQTRRDEERMRREEFLHEMELMYGRVQQQPLLFERYYAPRSYSPSDSLRSLTRKRTVKKRTSRNNLCLQITVPSEDFDGDLTKCLDKNGNVDKLFDNSDDVIDSIDRSCV